MFTNVHARQKDNTYYAQGTTKVICARKHDDSEFYINIRNLFGMAVSPVTTASSTRQLRTGAALYAARVFNFGRVALTQVMLTGVRQALPIIQLSRVMVNPSSKRFTAHVPEDIMGLIQTAASAQTSLEGSVCIAQYFRIVGKDHEELRTICRSMHFTEELVSYLENSPIWPTVTINGELVVMDVVTLTLHNSTIFGIHDNILDVFSNVMISRKNIERAPAHILDFGGNAMESQHPSTGVHYERSIVSNCVFVFHDQPTILRYTHDCGLVTEIPQVHDVNRPEGFYKEWHFFDEGGRLQIKRHFIERSKCNNASGFFARKVEALNYTPKKEIEEVYEQLNKTLNTFNEQMKASLKTLAQDIASEMVITRTVLERAAKERTQRDDGALAKMQEEIDRLKKEHAKSEREKEDLKQDLRDAKTFKRETADYLKVLGAAIGLAAVVFTQLKGKKKTP